MPEIEDYDRGPQHFDPDQQPIQRVIGRRVSPPSGQFPNAGTRAAMDTNMRYRTRVPKGIFFYQNHDAMTLDRDLWTLEAMLARQSDRG